jgi:hypothetical protein
MTSWRSAQLVKHRDNKIYLGQKYCFILYKEKITFNISSVFLEDVIFLRLKRYTGLPPQALDKRVRAGASVRCMVPILRFLNSDQSGRRDIQTGKGKMLS